MIGEQTNKTFKSLLFKSLAVISLFLIATFGTMYSLFKMMGIKSILLYFIYGPIYTIYAMIKFPRNEIKEYYNNQITNEERRRFEIISLAINAFLLPIVSGLNLVIGIIIYNLYFIIVAGLLVIMQVFLLTQSEHTYKTLRKYLDGQEEKKDMKIASESYMYSGFVIGIAFVFMTILISGIIGILLTN